MVQTYLSANPAKMMFLRAMLVASLLIGLSDVCVAAKSRHIERISSASLLEFYTEFALQNVPVIITDYASIYQNMTIQNILKYCGEKVVYQATTNGSGWARIERETELQLRELYQKIYENDVGQTSASLEPDTYGLFDWPMGRFCSELLEDHYVVPKYVAQDFLQRVPPNIPLMYRDSWPSLFIGRNNSFGGLHIDVFGSAFWQYVIDGRKEWHIMSPVVDFPADYSFFAGNGVESNVAHYHGVAKAGEFIFIPGNCPHQVKNIGNTIALAGNIVSVTEMDSMEREISGSDRKYYMQLQNTLMLETFDRTIDPQRGDMSYTEYKEQYKEYDQSIYIGHDNLSGDTREHTSDTLFTKDDDDIRINIEHLELLAEVSTSYSSDL